MIDHYLTSFVRQLWLAASLAILYLSRHPLSLALDLGWMQHILPRFGWLDVQFLPRSRNRT
jgi:hypothetical protein